MIEGTHDLEQHSDDWLYADKHEMEKAIDKWLSIVHEKGDVFRMMARSLWNIGEDNGRKDCDIDYEYYEVRTGDAKALWEAAEVLCQKQKLLTSFPPAIFCEVWRSAWVYGYIHQRSTYVCPLCGKAKEE